MARRIRQQTKRGSEGFAIVVIAALFVAFSVVITAFIDNKMVATQQSNQQTHQEQLRKLQGALTKFMLKEGRLPCPARTNISPNDMASEYGYEMHPVKTDASGNTVQGVSTVADCSLAVQNTSGWAMGKGIEVLKKPNTNIDSEYVRGMVPFKALGSYGITEDDAYDAQGARIMYSVNRQLTGKQAAYDATNTVDFTNGNAAGYASDHATITDVVKGTSINADFTLVSFGADKAGGLLHDQTPSNADVAATTDCLTATNTPIENGRKIMHCQIVPPVTCSAQPTSNIVCGGGMVVPYPGENCNTDTRFVTLPQNTSSQAVPTTCWARNSYFDDSVIGATVTCPNGFPNRSADGQCVNAYCWGSNASGQLGNGVQSMTPVTAPQVVSVFAAVPSFQAISVASFDTNATVCALTGDLVSVSGGNVYCWGSNTLPGNHLSKSPVPINASSLNTTVGGITTAFQFTSVQVGFDSICGMGGTTQLPNNDSNLYCWGKNDAGQLGNGSTLTTNYNLIPAKVPFTGGVTVKNYSGDGSHWCVVGSDEQLYCWGKNDKGQLGLLAAPDSNPHPLPVLASAVNSFVAYGGNFSNGLAHKIISVGSKGTTALLDDFTVIGWGTNWVTGAPYVIKLPSMNIQDTSTTPPTVMTLEAYLGAHGQTIAGTEDSRDRDISSSNSTQTHRCISLANGNAIVGTYCIGDNGYGQLGMRQDIHGADITTPQTMFVPLLEPSKTNPGHMDPMVLNSIVTGDGSSCALGADGVAYCWGKNDHGQLGIGNTSNTSTPTKVKMPNGVSSFSVIANGGATSCALAQ